MTNDNETIPPLTSSSLKKQLWEVSHDIRKGKLTHQQANAIANISQKIVAIAKLDITVLRMAERTPSKQLLEFSGGEVVGDEPDTKN